MGVGHGKMFCSCMSRTDLSRVLYLGQSNTVQQDRSGQGKCHFLFFPFSQMAGKDGIESLC